MSLPTSSESWVPRYPQYRVQLVESGLSPQSNRLLTVPLPSHPPLSTYRRSSLITPVWGSSLARPHESLRKRPKSSHSRIPSPLSTIIDVETDKFINEPSEKVQDLSDERSVSSKSLQPGKGKEEADDIDTKSHRSLPSSLNRRRPSSSHSVTSDAPPSLRHQRRPSLTATSRDPSLNWMTAPPSLTPVFTRAQISSRSVVMPLSASELTRMKTKSSDKGTVTRPHTAIVNHVGRNEKSETHVLVRRRASTLTSLAPPSFSSPPPKQAKNKSSWTSKIHIRPRTPDSLANDSGFKSAKNVPQTLDSLVPPSSPSPLSPSPTPSSSSFSSVSSSKSGASTVTSISSFETDIAVTPPTAITPSSPSGLNEIEPGKWKDAKWPDPPLLDATSRSSSPAPHGGSSNMVMDLDMAIPTTPVLDSAKTLCGVRVVRDVFHGNSASHDEFGHLTNVGASSPGHAINTVAVHRDLAQEARPRIRDEVSQMPPSKVLTPVLRPAAVDASSSGSRSISKIFKGCWKRLFSC